MLAPQTSNALSLPDASELSEDPKATIIKALKSLAEQ